MVLVSELGLPRFSICIDCIDLVWSSELVEPLRTWRTVSVSLPSQQPLVAHAVAAVDGVTDIARRTTYNFDWDSVAFAMVP